MNALEEMRLNCIKFTKKIVVSNAYKYISNVELLYKFNIFILLSYNF